MASIDSATARLPLTAIEKTILQDLVETLTNTKSESHFCCGGTIKISPGQALSLLYGVGGEDDARRLEFPPVKSDAIKKLLDACEPSAHGRGNKTVLDESYRLARELRQGSFALTMDILNESEVLESIASLTSSRNPGQNLVARLYKLNAYATGGFFKAHRDTPKSDRHVGTLVVALPVPFEGGALHVSHEGKHTLFEWDTNISGTSEQVALPWAFLFSDVEHEVLPVTFGTRVTLAYDIFASNEPHSFSPQGMDGTTLPFYTNLKSAMMNQDFLPRGGKVAVALSHAYPANLNRASDAFASHLKGSDAALHRILLAVGVPVEIRAVYTSELTHEYDDMKDQIPDDEYGPACILTRPSRYPSAYEVFQVLYTSNKFMFSEDDHWDDEVELLRSMYGAQLEPDLIWARRPYKDAFSTSGYYVDYGNEPCLASVYAAAAFVLDVPAVGQFPRVSV